MPASDDEEDVMGPPQDPNERREIRRKYREIQEAINEKRDDLQHPSNDGLQEKLTQCDDVFKSVKMTREASMDSAIVAQISHLGMKQAQALHTDFVTFDPAEFAHRLVRFLSNEGESTINSSDLRSTKITPVGWVGLGQAVRPFFRCSPALQLMSGAFDKGPPIMKERKKKAPEEKSAQASAKRPQEVAPSTMRREERTTEEVARIHNILEENCAPGEAVCFFEFVINPDSFGQTIENLFYTSFLVRDGLARISLDEDELPAIQPIAKPQSGEGPDASAHGDRRQVVMSFNMQEWRDIIETFNIREPMIPTRDAPA